MGLILDSSVVISAERRFLIASLAYDSFDELLDRIPAALSAIGLTELIHWALPRENSCHASSP